MKDKTTFTFYFELFGSKKQWTTEAETEVEARKKFNEFLLNSVTIVGTTKKKVVGDSGLFDKIFGENGLFDEVFGKDGIFERVFGKEKK